MTLALDSRLVLQENLRIGMVSGSFTELNQLLKSSLQEFNELEFKEEGELEKKKLARHILGMANSGGGCILFGVTDGDATKQPTPVGCTNLEDITSVRSQLTPYLGADLITKGIGIFDYDADALGLPALAGKKFRVLIVQPDTTHLPYFPKKGAPDLAETVYVRRDGASVPASHYDVQQLVLKQAAATAPAQAAITLEASLAQLKTLYTQLSPTISVVARTIAPAWGNLFTSEALLKNLFGHTEYEQKPNPNYPKESFEEFVSRAIELKKVRIRIQLGIAN